jgi:hypothetical protein
LFGSSFTPRDLHAWQDFWSTIEACGGWSYPAVFISPRPDGSSTTRETLVEGLRTNQQRTSELSESEKFANGAELGVFVPVGRELPEWSAESAEYQRVEPDALQGRDYDGQVTDHLISIFLSANALNLL